MGPADPSAVKEVFQAALDRDPGERQAFVDEACGDDAVLRDEVLDLLGAMDRSQGLMAAPTLLPGDEPPRPTERPGHRIDGYELLHTLGEGGFGTVWAARQREPIERTVAIKVIRGGMDSDQVVARFEAERQALALMDHPNVARVLDAGTTDDDQPYFVMELIRGLPITEHCEQRRLRTDDRLQLFLDVCRGIQHAHEKGVLHRDIKPSNVLVAEHDGRATPRIIDFGIAKATGGSLTERTLLTGSAQIVGTLQYMAPEQLEARHVEPDVRTDVYSLGVLLFELLTGRLPHDFEGKSLWEGAHMVQNEAPARLSTIRIELRGDLETIVQKALDRDPARRYAAVAMLAADVQSFLLHEPIRARPASALHQLRLYTRRHRALVTAALAALTSLTIGLALALAAKDDAQRARDVAEADAVRFALVAAATDLDEGRVDLGIERLQSVPETHRGWVWLLLAARVDQPRHTFEAFDNAFTADGTLRLITPRGVETFDRATGARTLLSELPREEGQLARLLAHAEVVVVPTEAGFSLRRATSATTEYHALAMPNAPRSLTSGWKLWGRFVLSCGAHATIDDGDHERVVDLNTGLVVDRFPLESSDAVRAISGDGQRLLVRHGDRYSIVDPHGRPTGDPYHWVVERKRSDGGTGMHFRFDEDGDRLAVVHMFGATELWDVTRPSRIDGLRLPDTRGAVVSDDGRVFAAPARAEFTVFVQREGEHVPRALPGFGSHDIDLDLAPDGSALATLERHTGHPEPDRGTLWDTDDPNLLAGHDSYVYAVAVSPDGRRIASGTWEGGDDVIRVWDAATGAPVAAWSPEGRVRIFSLAFAQDGRWLISAGSPSQLRIWDVDTGAELHQPCRAEGATVSPDGRTLSVLHSDRLKLLDLETLEAREGPVVMSQSYGQSPARAFHPSGDRLAVQLKNDAIALLDLDTLEPVAHLHGHERIVTSLAFSPDGRYLLSAAPDEPVHLWNAEAGTLVTRLRGTRNHRSVLWDATGQVAITGSYEGPIQLWDVAARDVLATLTGHQAYVSSLALTPDGSTLVSGSGDHTVRTWRIEPPHVVRAARRDRDALVAELEGEVAALFDVLEDADAVVTSLRERFTARRLEVALQLALGESVSRR